MHSRRSLLLSLLLLWTAGNLQAAEPLLTALVLEGSLPFSESKARNLLDLETGRPFDPEAAQAASNRLMEALRTAYHPLARVRWSAGPDADSSGLSATFRVEAGPKGTLQEVRFTGNTAISDADLLAVLTTRPRSGPWVRLTGRDVLLTETLAADQQALADRYQQEGFLDVRIGVPDLVHRGEGPGFRLTWPVETEGPRYRIGSVTVNGEVENTLNQAHAGRTASPERLHAVGRELRARLDRGGHAFAEVKVEPVWSPEAARVDLPFQVIPGPVSTLRGLRIEGNSRTDDRIFKRELAASSGDRFQRDQVDGFARRLQQTGLFEEVELTLHPVDNGRQFDLVTRVKEAHTGRIEGGVTFGEVEGLAFVTTLRERNFALRPPFRGQALEADVGMTLGSEILRVEGGLRNPRIGKSFWSLSSHIFYEDNVYVSDRYDQQSQGASLLLLHPVALRHLVGIGWVLSIFELNDIDPLLDAELSENDREVELSGPQAVWNFNATDRPFRPKSGGRMRQKLVVGLSGAGGDTEVLDWEAKGEWFFTLPRDAVLRLHASTRHIFPGGDTAEVPLSLRTFLGGADTLKAFEYHSVSGLDDNGTARGGESMWWGGPELLLPVLPRLDLALYTHAGDVGDQAGNFSGEGPVAEWGIGFLIRAENFPVRFDLAFPLQVIDGDPLNQTGEARFSFSAAYRF